MNIVQKIGVLTTIVLLSTVPTISHAAIFFSSASIQSVNVGDTFIVHTQFNTEGQNINTVEGTVEIVGNAAEVKELSVGGSALSLWPTKPSLSLTNNSNTIEFIGGVPGGFNKGDALLFNIILKATRPGQIIINPKTITAYENDGNGTSKTASVKPLTITIKASDDSPSDAWRELVSLDNTPPLDFVITLGQDKSAFGGQKFISFETTDSESGIDHYEIKEGDLNAVRSGSPYVLQSQKKTLPITVAAFDKAGNSRIVTWSPPHSLGNRIVVIGAWVIIISLIILGLKYLLVLWKNKKKR